MDPLRLPCNSREMQQISYDSFFTIYISPRENKTVKRVKGGCTNIKYGNIYHDEVDQYNTKYFIKKKKKDLNTLENIDTENIETENVETKNIETENIEKRNFVYIIKPSPYSLPRPTAVIHHPDISLIFSFLNLTSDSVILEAGYGSGVFCEHLRVKKTYSVEKCGERIDFERVDKNVSLWIGDVADVRKLEADKNNKESDSQDLNLNRKNDDEKLNFFQVPPVDAIFLDIPSPSIVLENLLPLLKPSGSICVYVISVQQVLSVTEEMTRLGYVPRVYENIGREYMGRKCCLGEGRMHTAYLIFGSCGY